MVFDETNPPTINELQIAFNNIDSLTSIEEEFLLVNDRKKIFLFFLRIKFTIFM